MFCRKIAVPRVFLLIGMHLLVEEGPSPTPESRALRSETCAVILRRYETGRAVREVNLCAG